MLRHSVLIINNFSVTTYLESIVNRSNPRDVLKKLFSGKENVDLTPWVIVPEEQHSTRLAKHKARRFSP